MVNYCLQRSEVREMQQIVTNVSRELAASLFRLKTMRPNIQIVIVGTSNFTFAFVISTILRGIISQKSQKAGVTVTYLRSYITGSNDIILNEVGRNTAVSGGGASWTRNSLGTQLWDISSWSRWATTVSWSGSVCLSGTGG
jgi:hypothetical protein